MGEAGGGDRVPFVIRPGGGASDDDVASIRLKDGQLVVLNSEGRRASFRLGPPDGPAGITRYYVSGGRYGGGYWRWVVVDSWGRSFFDVSERAWKVEDLERLGKAIGIPVGPNLLRGSGRPPQRPDYFDTSGRMPWWSIVFYIVFCIAVLPSAFSLGDYPLVWPVLWVACGVVTIIRRAQIDAATRGNRALLPRDEDAAKPSPTQDAPTRGLVFAAIALLPPVLAQLLTR